MTWLFCTITNPIMSFSKLAMAASFTLGIAGAGYIYWSFNHRRHCTPIPTDWVQVGMLSDLLAYPIKSCQWVQLEEAECTNMGLRSGWLRDRTLMVIDKNSNFITARAYPELLRVKSTFDASKLTISHPNMEPVTVDLSEVERGEVFIAKVWSTPVGVKNCGWETSEWFSRLINKDTDSLRLVLYASDRCRMLRATANPVFHFQDQDTGALPDETSYNMINEASIEDMNRRINGSEVTAWPRQFRPNFVVKGSAPLAEDDWKFVRLGDNIFEVIKPCTRCIMTTINPETAIKNPNSEPLNTLKSYRQPTDLAMRKSAGSSPRMGLQLALRSAPGQRVRIDDPVYVPAPVSIQQ